MNTGRQGSLGTVLKAGYHWNLVSALLQRMGKVLVDNGSVIVEFANTWS